MVVPGRTKECQHINCFDIETFAKLAETQSYTIPCPSCRSKKKWNASSLLIDSVMEDILETVPKRITKIKFLQDGKWEALEEEVKDEKKNSLQLQRE
jgi:hypothetical protein